MFTILLAALLLASVCSAQPSKTDYSNAPSSLNVLYIEPGSLSDAVFSLNEKSTLGNTYKKGWILPSMEELTLNLYLYYDNEDETKIRPFVKSSVFSDDSAAVGNATTAVAAQQPNQQQQSQQLGQKQPLYAFFTPMKNCLDYLSRNSWPLEIVERLAPNTYKAQLKSLSLPYSNESLYICMQQFDADDNINDQHRFYAHQGTDYWVTIALTRSLIPTWLRVVLFFVLLTLSGLFSGLNLGLMSLDVNELETLKRIGTPKEQSYAAKIYPLRRRGNFLLCTILLGNVLVNSVSTLLLGDMLSGVYAALGSTILIVIFGEIIPQAACSKHGLAVGAYTRYIMYTFMLLTSPLSFPLSMILDKVLGQEIVATYNREKLRELMMNVEDLDDKEKKIITGALDFNKKKVRAIMTRLDDVFMLEINSRLDFEAIARIAQNGFSRIPVYQASKENVVGLLHVKDFTLLDPDDNMPVRALLEFYNHTVITCDAERPIDEMFEEFRKGETHLAFVTDVVFELDKDPMQTYVGIVTLEDILEELVQMEIYDEFDDKKEIEEEVAREQAAKDDEPKPKPQNPKKSDSKEGASLKANQTQADSLASKPSATFNTTNNNNSSNDLLANSLSLGDSQKGNALQKSFSSATAATTPHYETQASKDFSFFLQQQKDSSQRALISPQVRFVMFQFLFTTVRPFTSEFLTKNVLELLFKRAIIKESRHTDSKAPTEYLYRYNKGCSYFILILSGEAIIEVGQERLEFPAGPFAYFGVDALLCGSETAEQVLQEDRAATEDSQQKRSTSHHHYVPDFSLRVDDRCVYLKIDRDLWRNGVVKSNYERVNNHLSDSIEYIPAACVDDPQSTSTGELHKTGVDTTRSLTTSPHHQVLLKKFKDTTTPSQLLLPASGVKSAGGGRRSTISAAVLGKAQEMAKSMSKLSQSKLGQKSDNVILELKEINDDDEGPLLTDSGSNIDHNAAAAARFLTVKSDMNFANGKEGCESADDAEKEPFINRSTFSLNLEPKVGGGEASSKRLKSECDDVNFSIHDKFESLSQGSH